MTPPLTCERRLLTQMVSLPLVNLFQVLLDTSKIACFVGSLTLLDATQTTHGGFVSGNSSLGPMGGPKTVALPVFHSTFNIGLSVGHAGLNNYDFGTVPLKVSFNYLSIIKYQEMIICLRCREPLIAGKRPCMKSKETQPAKWPYKRTTTTMTSTPER